MAGQIQLETLKPLEYGKRRLQFDLKGNVNPDQLDQDDTEAGDLGYRFTGSYVDQFELGTGDIGFSIGVQRSDISQPEAESRQTGPTSNSRPACLITNGNGRYIEPTTLGTVTGFSNNPETRRRGDDDCDDLNLEGFDLDDLSGSASPTPEELEAFGRGSFVEGVDTGLINGVAPDAGVPFVFAPSQRHFRQNDTRDERDAVFGAIEWSPNDRWNINLDAQYSERTQTEQRNDLTFNGGRRNDTSLNIGPGGTTTTLDSLVATPSGAVLRSITDNSIEIQGGDFERRETYTGAGANIVYDVTNRLTVSADYGYSNTNRIENNREFRLQSDISPVIEFDRRGNNVPSYTLYDEVFDVNDYDNYVDRLRIRIDNDLERDNTIHSGRFDVAYDLGDGFFTGLEAGVRWAQQDYLDFPGGAESSNPLDITNGRFSFEIENDGELTVNNREVIDDNDEDEDDPLFAQSQLLQSNIVNIIGSTRDACRTEFPEGSSFLSSQRNGDLVTNIDDDGTIISSTNTWATLDAGCVAETSVNSLNDILSDINAYLTNPDAEEASFSSALNAFSSDIPGLNRENTRTIDVQETTQAIYLMTTYDGSINGSLPISGNLGLRVVQTDVEATGFRRQLIVNDDDGELSLSFGDLETIRAENDYTRFLPSATLIAEVAPDKIVRLGAFRAMSRADPADMGFGRQFSSNTGDDENPITTLEQLIDEVDADGNPELDPLMSWNYDASFEWYPNEDSILAVGAYYKAFQGGFENVRQNETFVINGTDITRPVSVQQTSDDQSSLFGIELTATHRFSYLPGILSGLGAKLSYNYVQSDFEFEDSRYGDAFTRNLDGSVTQTNQGIIAPAGLPGLSENTLSTQVYYQIGDFDMQVNYKYRDEYFQPFISDGTRLRYVGDIGVWEARASYDVTDNFRLSVEAINLFSAPKEQFAFVRDDLYEVNDYGPRVFFGLRGRF